MILLSDSGLYISLNATSFADELAKSFSGSHDVVVSDSNPIISADYSCRDESFIISPKFNIYSAEDRECIRVYRTGIPDDDCIRSILDESWNSGISAIKPSKGHRSSFIFTIIISEGFGDDIGNAVSGYVRRKSFRFMLDGTVIHYAMMIDSVTGKVVCGRGAKPLAESVKNVYKRCCR